MTDERKMILDMLSQGKITAEEAQNLLDALPQEQEDTKSTRGESQAKIRGESQSIMGGIVDSIRTGLAGIDFSDFSFEISDSSRITLEETHSGEFDSKQVELDLQARNGSIRVESWDQPGYKLDIIKRVKASTREQAEELASQYSYATLGGDKLHAGDQDSRKNGKRIYVSLRLRLPTGHTYTGLIKTMNGGIGISGLDLGELELGSMNGSVKVGDVRGNEITAKTVNGSLRMEGSLDSVSGITTNGSVSLANFAEDSENHLETVNGRIVVKVPVRSDIAISVLANTTSGSIKVYHSNLDELDEKRKVASRKLEGRSSNWSRAAHQVELSLKSVNGSIKVEDLE